MTSVPVFMLPDWFLGRTDRIPSLPRKRGRVRVGAQAGGEAEAGGRA
jgi:hypothetical protein